MNDQRLKNIEIELAYLRKGIADLQKGIIDLITLMETKEFEIHYHYTNVFNTNCEENE